MKLFNPAIVESFLPDALAWQDWDVNSVIKPCVFAVQADGGPVYFGGQGLAVPVAPADFAALGMIPSGQICFFPVKSTFHISFFSPAATVRIYLCGWGMAYGFGPGL